MHSIRTLALAVAIGGGLTAQTLIVPSNIDAVTEGTTSQSYPWNRDSATSTSNDLRFQVCYDDSNFASISFPILISQLRWRANAAATTSSWTGGDFSNCDIKVGVAGLDYTAFTTTFDANWPGGTPPASAYTGPVTIVPGTGNGTGIPGPWYISVTLNTPVLYDPASGDLLMEITHDGVFTGATTGAWSTDAQSTGALGCRMYNISDYTASTGSGPFTTALNVCELTYTPVAGIYANFTVDNSAVAPGTVVNFTDTSYTSDPGGITSWAWDFDNNPGTIESSAQNPSWVFTGCGPQNVTLTVTDATGFDTITKIGIADVQGPLSSFTATPSSGAPPLIVQFTDTSTNNPTSWSWDLDGDGVFGDSTLQNPTWAYPTADLFTASLIASNSCPGNTATTTISTLTPGLCTQFGGTVGWTNGAGFYFDVNVLNPAGLTIKGLGVQIQNAGVPFSIDVWTIPGTYVGNDTNQALWTLTATGGSVSTVASGEATVNTNDFCLAPGSHGMCVVYNLPGSERFNYTSSGATSAANADLALSGGLVRYNPGAFTGTSSFSPRNWNGCFYYEVGQVAGTYTQIGTGCVNSTGSVADLSLQSGAVPTYGQAMTFEISNAPASEPLSFVMFGFYDVGGVDLGVIGMPGCPLHADGVVSLNAPTNAMGIGTAVLGIPNEPSQLGATFYTQPFIKDLGQNLFGAVTGNAKRGVVGCP